MTLYGHFDVESSSSGVFFPRNIPTLTKGPFYLRNQIIQHQDLSHSYQSGGGGGGGANFQHRGPVFRSDRAVMECPSAIGLPVGGSASSWQPTCDVGGVSRHLPPVPSRRSTAKKSSVRVKLTAAAIMGAAFRTFPFGIHPQIFGLNKTVSQRRWVHFHTAGKE